MENKYLNPREINKLNSELMSTKTRSNNKPKSFYSKSKYLGNHILNCQGKIIHQTSIINKEISKHLKILKKIYTKF